MNRRLLLITEEEWLKRAHTARSCVRALAKDLDIPERTLRRHIQSMTGQSPHDWLRRLRLGRSPSLLVEGLKVEWIASELGYRNAKRFARAFKQFFGCTAGEFLRRPRLGMMAVAGIDTQ